MRGLLPTGQCNRYSPPDGAQSAFVQSPNVAWTAHGYQGSCPSTHDLNIQSSLGFEPTDATSIPTGVPFNLGLFKHYNWPINGAEIDSTGHLDVRLLGTTLDFPWSWEETPNNCQGTGCSDDHVQFTGQIGNQVIEIDNIDHRLVILGFTQEGQQCGTAPANPYINSWRTVEGVQNYACLWAELAQIRPLKVKKVSIDGAPSATFSFSSTSNLAGSPWDGDSWNLAIGEKHGPQSFLPSEEDVAITEAAKANWALDSVVCRDGNQDEMHWLQRERSHRDASQRSRCGQRGRSAYHLCLQEQAPDGHPDARQDRHQRRWRHRHRGRLPGPHRR